MGFAVLTVDDGRDVLNYKSREVLFLDYSAESANSH